MSSRNKPNKINVEKRGNTFLKRVLKGLSAYQFLPARNVGNWPVLLWKWKVHISIYMYICFPNPKENIRQNKSFRLRRYDPLNLSVWWKMISGCRYLVTVFKMKEETDQLGLDYSKPLYFKLCFGEVFLLHIFHLSLRSIHRGDAQLMTCLCLYSWSLFADLPLNSWKYTDYFKYAISEV